MSAREARGFLGLATLMSDVSVDIADAERLGRFSRPPAPTQRAVSTPAPPVIRAPLGGMSVGAKWALGIGVVVAIVWLISAFEDRPSPRRVAPPRVETPSEPSPPVTVPSARSGAPAPPRSSSTALDLYGVKPPVGTGLVLDANQIRYCLTETIRLETISPLVDTRSDQEVDRFNARIRDLNSRCANFRYRPGTLERAQQEIESRRATIENLARLQWEAQK